MKKLIPLFLCFILITKLNAQNRQDQLDSLINAYTVSNLFHGSVLVAHKGEVLLHKGYGYRNAGNKQRHDTASIFQIGSVTKQFTAALILKLQELGKLSVDDRLTKYFPDYPNGDKITIRHLLNHTSGIFNYTANRGFMEKEVADIKTSEYMISLFKDKPLDFEPGEKYNYSNSAYLLLGYIAEKSGGKPYTQQMHEWIFRPLGMRRSGFKFTELKHPAKAIGYTFITADTTHKAHIVDSTVSGAAGAVYSTTGDLYLWAKAVLDGNVLSDDSWSAALKPGKQNYGYGWVIDSMHTRRVYHHSGGIHGFNSNIAIFPEEGSVVILLSNVNTSVLGKITNEIASVVFDVQQTPTAKVDLELLKSYEGNYQITPQFILNVLVVNGELTVQPTAQPRLELIAESPVKFRLKLVEAGIEFIKDDSGKVTGLTLTQAGRTLPAKRID